MKFAALILVTFCVYAPAQTFEQKVVAAVLMGEAWDQGQVGMLAVAEVIHQRCVETGLTPLEVVTKGGFRHRAFSCLNERSAASVVKKFSSQADFERLALPLAVQVYRWPSNQVSITHHATHFTRKEEKPWWAKGYRPVVVIGEHAFYRLPASIYTVRDKEE
jgi:N-acetylmuramoyl-L-alanine amidase